MANIKYWKLECDTIRPAPVVNGILQIEGEFSWEEWVKLRGMAFRMRSTGVPKSNLITKAQAIQNALKDIQAGNGEKYKTPSALTDSH